MDLGLVGVPLRGEPQKRPLRRAPDYENNWNKNQPIQPPPRLFNYKPASYATKKPSRNRSFSSASYSQSSSHSRTPSQSIRTFRSSDDPSSSQSNSNAPIRKAKQEPKECTIEESCHHALSSLEDLGVRTLSHLLDDYHSSIRTDQQRKSLAARAEYLKQKLYGHISPIERALAPHTFGWQETPWTLDMNSASESLHAHEIEHGHRHTPYVWIGETRNPDNVLESAEEAAMWETLRHAEARAFPLENDEIVRNVFAGLEQAMTAEDVDSLERQWQERPHYENRPPREDSPEPEIFKKFNVNGKKKVGFSGSKEHENDSRSDDGSSNSGDTETLFSPSQDPTPYGTPYHTRSRSIDPDNYVAPLPKEKSISQKRLEADLAAKKAKEEMELSCKFKATPVPASSLLPRFDEIMRKMGNKSTKTRNERANDLMSKIKPFSFSSTGCDADHSSQSTLMHCKCKSQSNKFIQDMLEEIEQEKKDAIRKKSAYLLTSKNSLAAHAAEDGRKKRQQLLERQKTGGITPYHSFKPKINHNIPDFKTLQSEFERELESKKGTKPKVVPQPFQGLEEHEQQAEQKKRNRERQEARQLEKGLRKAEFKATHNPALGDEPPPLTCKETKTSVLKVMAAQKKIEELAKKEEQAETPVHLPKEREKEMITKLQTRFEIANSAKRQRAEALRAKLAKEERQRVREYKLKLREIEEKLEDRLCLFELVSIDGAKRKARREVEEILKAVKV